MTKAMGKIQIVSPVTPAVAGAIYQTGAKVEVARR